MLIGRPLEATVMQRPAGQKGNDMSTFSSNIGPEEEDGAGWGGLVPTKAERALVAAVNKALTEALAGAEECRGKPSFAGVRPEWDDGYVAGIKCAATIVQAAMAHALSGPQRPARKDEE